jgi:hypothetical protein
MISLARLIELAQGRLHGVFLCFDPPVNGRRCASILVRSSAALATETPEAVAMKCLEHLPAVERECVYWVIVYAPSKPNADHEPAVRFRHRHGLLLKAEGDTISPSH